MRALHAEQNAIIRPHYTASHQGAAAYAHSAMPDLRQMLINSGIRLVYAGNYPDDLSRQFLRDAGVELKRLPLTEEADTVYQPNLFP